MKYSALSNEEEKKVQVFFLEKFQVPLLFWHDTVLLKRVHSVWVCSKKAAELASSIRTESVGLLLLLEFKTLKPSKQGLAFLKNKT